MAMPLLLHQQILKSNKHNSYKIQSAAMIIAALFFVWEHLACFVET
jgi:hypothetical protein